MREDLLKIIRQHDDLTNVIVLTHNIHFVFVETMVLAALKHCGHPTFTVFADAQCASDTFAHQAAVLNGLGIRYRVVPVAMETGFRFHPKALLLSGPTKATLLVGSGNLTFGGWRENAEIWVKFETDEGQLGAFAAFHRYMDAIVDRVPLSDPVRAEVNEAFDGKTREWAVNMGEPASLLTRVGGPVSLIDQISGILKGRRPRRLTVCAPYFDDDGDALKALVSTVGATRTRVFVQSKKTGLRKSATRNFGKKTELVTIDFHHDRPDGTTRAAFVHAKFYAVDRGRQTLVFAGSANCSRAALTIPGTAGNAELLAIQEMPSSVFEEQLLSELDMPGDAPTLAEPVEIGEEKKPDHMESIRILAARYEAGDLLVAFSCPDTIAVSSCFVDDLRCDFEVIESGIARVLIGHSPRRVLLEGKKDGIVLRSDASWIDHEHELRSTSRGRDFADGAREKVRPDAWNISAWADIGEVFYKHLKYIPPRSSIGFRHGARRDEGADEVPEFTAEDVFSSAYAVPKLSTAWIPVASTRDSRIQDLQEMLLRWFGVRTYEPEERVDETDTDEDEDEDEDEDTVDRPKKIPKKEKPRRNTAVSDRDRRRAKRILRNITEAMTSKEFLEHRSPELLATDLKVTAVLLRIGLKEDWISTDEFFDTTHKVWSSLFFSSEADQNSGWLQYRYETSASPTEFVARMSSVDLSAALLAWALTVPHEVQTPEHARFVLSWVLSIARLPWLWHGGDSKEIAAALGHILYSTDEADSGEQPEASLDEAGQRWIRMMRRGHALGCLEAALDGRSPAELRHRISQNHVAAGELLWQGEKGFCVAKNECKREEGRNLVVLRLQAKESEDSKYENRDMKYSADYTIPIRSLLDPNALGPTLTLSEAAREELATLVDELAGKF